ncbi:transposase [Solilutibacter silvestris]|uniref:Transposase n=1 Tax=Solilutibacter silvestris TaxID=1645665 RepID=A0A2K1Q490_9GAMM|nr:transposase [Lysobacter silvestris]PNS09821.1 Transposase [Lysobacter silvestris]
MGKHRSTDEKIRILAEAMSGNWDKVAVARRHSIHESTLYDWMNEFPYAADAYAVLQEKGRSEYLSFLFKNSDAKHGQEEFKLKGGVDYGETPDYPNEFWEWEERRLEQIDADTRYRLKVSVPRIGWMPAARWDQTLSAKVHGKRFPSEKIVKLQLRLPAALHDRLKKQSEGSLNQVITGLIGYALETLDTEYGTLHIYDRLKPAPKIRTSSVKNFMAISADQNYRARRKKKLSNQADSKLGPIDP